MKLILPSERWAYTIGLHVIIKQQVFYILYLHFCTKSWKTDGDHVFYLRFRFCLDFHRRVILQCIALPDFMQIHPFTAELGL